MNVTYCPGTRRTAVSRSRTSPFDLDNEAAYERWRQEKLRHCPTAAAALTVAVADPAAPTREERDAIVRHCRWANMAIYVARPDIANQGVLAFARHFGLRRLDTPLWTGDDGVSEIRTAGEGRRAAYIPYSDKPLSWHTDGYYNEPDRQVRGVLLHCARAAASGGETALLDPEIAYIRLRDENPGFIAALTQPDVLTIPANLEAGRAVRPAQTGPVFSLLGGCLHMRYTARKRYAEWKHDPTTTQARAFLTALLEGDEKFIIRHRFEPGEGIICNNVLHNRSAFSESRDPDHGRLLYRARFLDRVATTN